jgi:putative ABC transport system ATP-binding protein
MIALEHVCKAYDVAGVEVRALDDIVLEIPAGQFVVVRGPSGSGKSTLLALVGGLSRPSSGRIVVAGRDLAKLGPAALARFRAETVGFVFQTFHLLPYLNVVQNLALGATVGRESDAQRQAHSLLERFGLGHRRNHVPAQLSIGECQRVAIARAILKRPPLLLADEPTGNLDSANAGAVFDMLAAFHADGGTVVLATHQDQQRLSAPRTLSLCEGKLRLPEAGPAETRSDGSANHVY